MIISVLISGGQAEAQMGKPFISYKTTNGCEAVQSIRAGAPEKVHSKQTRGSDKFPIHFAEGFDSSAYP